MVRSWSVSHELGLFNCFLQVFAFVFSFIFLFFSFSAFQLIVRSFIHLRHSLLSSNIHYLLCHDRPFPSSIEIDASVFLESLFEDTFGAFAWSMVIDWSIFLEYGSLMEFDDGWIGHLFLRGSSDD